MAGVLIMEYFCIFNLFTLTLCSGLNTTERNNRRFGTDQIVKLPDSEKVVPRTITTENKKMWPNAVVPYEVDSSFDTYSRKKLQKAIKLFHQISCVRFVPRTGQTDYVKFVPTEDGCTSYVGRTRGKQNVWLSDGCFKAVHLKGAVVHEMMHVLGFVHEQMRDDRDCYVKLSGVGKTLRDFSIMYDIDTSWIYDYRSLMHYKARKYFKALHGERIGNYAGTVTFWDRMKINYLYCNQPHYCQLYKSICSADDVNERFCRTNKP